MSALVALSAHTGLQARTTPSWRWDEHYGKNEVMEAADYGLNKMNQLVYEQEPRLYGMGMFLPHDNPARYVAAFNSPDAQATRLAKYGYASLQATSKLVQHLYDTRGLGRIKFPIISLLNTALHERCPLREVPPCPLSSSRYRTADGRCNNPAHPWWGASMMALNRFLPPNYRDGLERIRESVSGGPLPSARVVSAAIHGNRDIDLTTITHMVMQWGQFLDHDLTASSQKRGFNASVPKCCTDGGHRKQPADLMHPDCLPISVPTDDFFYGPHGVRCLEFVRSSPTSRIGCSLGPRDQINQVTSFIDASNVYGSSESVADRLRLYRNGLLKYSRVAFRLPLLPASHHKADLCREAHGHMECFDAGDKRVNEQPGLIAMHVLWLRVHNRLATQLGQLNAHWDDERLYQEARRIVVAMMQHITYREFLPIVLGPDVVKLFELDLSKKGYYKGYDIKVNPTAVNAFGTAAFRFGHSLVQQNLLRCDRLHQKLPSNVSLHEELTVPSNIYNVGSVDRLLLGLCTQSSQKRDEFITQQLTNHLFQTPHFRYGMDLAAINIQRGRDHGLAPYNAWRAPCGLQPFTEWVQLLKVMSPETQRKLKKVYRDIDDIDLFSGAMAERPVTGGLVGPTFACIIAQQFSNLRKGDRFWYESGGFKSSFTSSQLQQLRRVTLARVLCDNLDSIDTVQPFVFLNADHNRNKHVSCESGYILQFDITPWTEHPKSNDIIYNNYPEKEHINEYSKPTVHPSNTENYEHHYYSTKKTTEKPYDNKLPSYPLDQNYYSETTTNNSKPHTDYSPSYSKPHTDHSPSYSKPHTNISPSYSKPHTDHSPSYSKPHTDHSPSYSKPHTDHSPSYSKPHTDHSPNYFKPHTDRSPSYSKPHTDNSPSYSKPPTDHSPSYSKPHIHHSSSYSKPHTHHSPSYSKPPTDHSPSYSKPHTHHSPSYSKPHTDHSPSYSKPHTDNSPSSYKPHTDNSPNYSKPHTEHSSYFEPNSERPTIGKPKPPNYSNSNEEHLSTYLEPHTEQQHSYSDFHTEHSKAPSSYSNPDKEHSTIYFVPNIEYSEKYSTPNVEYLHKHSKPHIIHSLPSDLNLPILHDQHPPSSSSDHDHLEATIQHSYGYAEPNNAHVHKHPTLSYPESLTEHQPPFIHSGYYVEHSSKPHNSYHLTDVETYTSTYDNSNIEQPKPHDLSTHPKPVLIYSPSYPKPNENNVPSHSKPHKDYLDSHSVPVYDSFPSSNSGENQHSSSNLKPHQATLIFLDHRGPSQTKPPVEQSTNRYIPSLLYNEKPKDGYTSIYTHFKEPIYYHSNQQSSSKVSYLIRKPSNEEQPESHTSEPVKYIFQPDEEVPSSRLPIEGRHPTTEEKTLVTNSNGWSFNEDDVEEEDVPDVPAIFSDPQAIKELPHPIIFEDEEDGRGLI